MENLETELKSVLEKLTPMLLAGKKAEDEEAKKAVKELTEEQLKILEQLEHMLKNKNPQCINHVDELRKMPETEELVRQIEDFEFRKASDALNELLKTIKNGL